MPNITIKNIPEDLLQHLKQSAESNHRSLNREIIACIKRAMSVRKIRPDALLEHARLLREKTAKHPITDATFNRAKRAGRP
jgi:antitoxin FitA